MEIPKIDLGDVPRILLVRLSAIGDVVVATPAIHALRAAYPGAYLAWLVEDRAQDVVLGNPELDEVIVWPRQAWKRELTGPGARVRHMGRVAGLVRELRARQFDVAIDFQGLLRSALLVYASGARHRIATAGTREGSGRFYTIRLPRPADLSSRQRCLDLLQPLGVCSMDRRMAVPFTEADRSAAARMLAEAGAAPNAPYACLCPATTWANKHWSESAWARLADGLSARGLTPVFLGARGDRPLIERILAHCRPAPTERGDAETDDSDAPRPPPAPRVPGSASPRPVGPSPVVLAGLTTLKQAAALLEAAAVGVAVDTGLLHIGVAVGARMVALCGPSYWPGFQDYASERVRIVRKPFECSPCLRRPTCPHTPDMEAYTCMLALSPEEILGEIEGLRVGTEVPGRMAILPMAGAGPAEREMVSG
jgi:heptosyltransferase-1